MEPMDYSPFLCFRGRTVLVLVLATMFAASLAGAMLWPDWARLPGEHRLEEACVQLLWYGLLAGSLYMLSRRAGVDSRMIWGRGIGFARFFVLVAWAVPLVGLSMATAYAIFVPLSYVAPELVEHWVLDNPLSALLGGGIRFDLANVLLFVAVVFAAPIVEEYGFRGLLLSRWAVKWGTPTGIVMSSLAFAIWHIDPLGGFVFGYAAGVAYLETGSLAAPITLHIANNVIAWTMAVLASDTTTPATIARFQEQWIYGLLALAVSAPWGVWLFRRNGMMRGKSIPYLVAQRQRHRVGASG